MWYHILVAFDFDDDKEEPVRSRAESLTNADAGKQEQRERKAADRGKLAKLKREMLQKRVETADAGKKQDETERAGKKKEPEVKTFGTQTQEKEIKEQVATAKTEETPDTLVQEGQRQEALEEQTPYERQKDAG